MQCDFSDAIDLQTLSDDRTSQPSSSDRKFMLFDLSIYGHHPGYIQYLIEHWHQNQLQGSLIIVVSPQFLTEHADVVELGSKLSVECSQGKIEFVAITTEEEGKLKPRTTGIGRNLRNFQEWSLLCKYAKALQASHILVMYFDTYQLPLALGMSPPCPVSGIYFRPTFHYSSFADYKPTRKEKIQQRWEQLLLTRVLHHIKFRNLFSLDPFAGKFINNLPQWSQVIHLPDPVRIEATSNSELVTKVEHCKTSLGVEPSRKVFLLFGALTGRKGVYQVLDAVPHLSSDLCQTLSLVLVGGADPQNREQIETKARQICQSQPIQIIRHYEFVPEQDVQTYFHLADLVLAPYQRHVGMSGILILAAAAQKPVLSSNYGLMGELVRRYQLGLTVDSTIPTELAKGLAYLLSQDLEAIGDRTNMQRFAEENASERFARTIFGHLSSAQMQATARHTPSQSKTRISANSKL